MKINHLIGHNGAWNYSIYSEDGIGHEFIMSYLFFSSVNKKILNSLEFKFVDLNLYFLSHEEVYIDYEKDGKKSQSKVNKKLIEKGIVCKKAGDFKINYDLFLKELDRFKYENILIPFFDYNLDLKDKLALNSEKIKEFRENVKQQKEYLSYVVSYDELKNEENFERILTWITKFDIKGVYLILKDESSSEIKEDIEGLKKYIELIETLKENDLEVHLGYNNNESFLLSVAMPDSITLGTYKNLRIFSKNNFIARQTKKANFKVFSPLLLNTIQQTYVENIEAELRDNEKLNKYFPLNKYLVLKPETSNWQFKEPAVYKYHMFELYKLLKKLPPNKKERKKYIIEKLNKSIEEYNFLTNELRIRFDPKDSGDFLYKWLSVLEQI